ncbi:hypothetical protein M5K25_022995 [Dendrobium thyrsiflorum]|uniref:Uncharacterized protein n=1 Tax=Dendrobium thyrsiflorum TaxID=117978 RepID=A0ABD0U779_DENTH
MERAPAEADAGDDSVEAGETLAHAAEVVEVGVSSRVAAREEADKEESDGGQGMRFFYLIFN